MEFEAVRITPGDYRGDALLVGLFQDGPAPAEVLSALDPVAAQVVLEVIAEEEFKPKPRQKLSVRVGSAASVRKVVLVGLGERSKYTLEALRQAVGEGARALKAIKAASAGVWIPPAGDDELASVEAIVEGLCLALHTDARFRSHKKNGDGEGNGSENKLAKVSLIVGGEADFEAAIRKGNILAEGTIFARELVSAPANYVTPTYLAEQAQAIADAGGLTSEILEKEDCERLGMGAYLGVAQGSDMPPKFIHLTYKPAEGTPRKRLAIIGKGLTFDSGGLSIKPAKGMELMKIDMGGAAAALGAARALAQLKPNVEVHFIVAATENMVSGHAIHPGDILTASNGKTIEVDNTDAEGRLTLADALVFAEKLGVDAIVDLATLTGACVVALGNDIAGLLSPNDELASQVRAAGEASGEKFWPLPMEDTYFENMKSVVADMRNTGSRDGGTITAALFLKQFVEKTPWVHLDIAGPVWTEKQRGYLNRGGTGFGVRTLVRFVLAQ
ncbi:leucyl aminopeptidase [Gloeobacter kilaueensis]|uniref:Probable cytosol aminopeptidase n=1 Tax=Gloeobacter kilaueensis (strain ATCC BAA-2537 / CCAP 1431/1 / ULC 316 / JS1) TaxID=1183438 RepID=U5QKL8_GLOK1|nr:leucyl aminopeptidase [Gloeobacter kilaueensis]AGY59461.1 leucyl aminopeptidase [Gloeobacter kilaueensis JS1]